MNLLVVGSVALDSVETPYGMVDNALGGSAVYFSVSASYFTDVGVVAVIGLDFPEDHLNFLKSKRIDLRGLKRESGLTFHWKGRYSGDLNEAETIDTKLNVFEDFRPYIPEEYRESSFVFLANIDPELQLNVLEQVKRPKLTICDTMNFWIEGKLEQLKEIIKRVDILIINEGEVRQLSRETNLIKAYQKISSYGPKILVVKQGSYGALLFTPSSVFSAPAYPLEELSDPTGAGDCFAGGFVGYLAKSQDTTEDKLRKAVIYGSVMASFNVEDFSLGRLKTLTIDEIEKRFESFKKLTQF
ncbi:MAG: sugar kinase [Deltaproteobacteria bacterium]|nr:sugar kinase [Deltaproteobacteria bacterium]MBW2651515.1 sugar kinase [Deltaproteobacteria bacterium]NOQ87269.1 sugar kinase [Deltaproteobacteria bacterium]